MAEPYGAFALVLHSHLPYVLSHNRLEEEWLLEAVAESYLPLLHALERLVWQGISPQVTVGVTPVLLEQLTDPRFASTLHAYLEQKSRAAEEDRRTFQQKREPYLARLARLWEELYRRTMAFFTDDLLGDLIGALRRLQQQGHIEILTSAATHAYLPLLGLDASVRAQIELATAGYRRHFRTRPQGFWLPECAYRPAAHWTPPLAGIDGLRPADRQSIDRLLSASGMRYFLVDSRQLKNSPPDYERHSPYHPYWVDGKSTAPSPPVAVFGRDFETTAQVWQHDTGYPGDPSYLEFHKKQRDGGLRYWRITDRGADLAYKQPYVPEWAFTQVSVHAAHFAQVLRERLRTHWRQTGRRGIVVAAFDTELFGHWWFEGPQWVYELLRQLARSDDVSLTTCAAYLHQHPPQRTVALRESSWGDGGDHRVWWQDGTRRLWRNVYQAECGMQGLGEHLRGKKINRQLARILRQCGRELLLLQASDWPFMISTRSTPDHAQRRAAQHSDNFQRCRLMAERYIAAETVAEEDWQTLERMEQQDALFPELDPDIFWEE
ncbi:MAG TPA: 1,4-alpha-glucan branching protein domain-containing protein [Candidatus Binatia bacterium]|jgi:1,4-alpha-glucan branching enzyme|nr:1,4-alpha-glucan branching protein domain-containing protein [Candidatus Binatia bacterium]